jgi:hypothetical protein
LGYKYPIFGSNIKEKKGGIQVSYTKKTIGRKFNKLKAFG